MSKTHEVRLWKKVTTLFIWITLAFMTGCQMDVGGSVSMKGFYPDKAGEKIGTIGDPRKAQYAPERTEGFNAGAWSEYQSIPKLGGGK